MSFATESKKSAGAKPVASVEMQLDSCTKKYANVDHCGDEFVEGRILSISGAKRALDLIGQQPVTSEATIVFDDGDAVVGELLNGETIRGKTGTIKLGFKETDGSVSSQTMHTGLLERRGVDAGSATAAVAIRPELRRNLGFFQRSITPDRFPNAALKHTGRGMNIVVGGVSPVTSPDSGVAWCPIVDTSARKLALCQHDTGGTGPGNLYRVKSDVVTLLTAAGGDFTYDDVDVDGLYDVYHSITLSAGVYDYEAEYYADSFPGMYTSTANDPAKIIKMLIDRFSIGSDMGLNFNGTDEYLSIADDATIDITGDMTIDIDVTFDTISAAALAYKRTGSNGYSLESTAGGELQLRLYDSASLTFATVTTNAADMVADTKYHIRVVYNSATPEIIFYINNTEIARATNTAQTGCTLTNSIPTAIGANANALTIGAVSGVIFLDGIISSFGLSDTVIPNGVAINANNSVVYLAFPFDTNDRSGNGNNATMFNMDNSNYVSVAGLTDDTSFSAFSTLCSSRGYTAYNHFAGLIPVDPGNIENPLDVLENLCRSVDAALYVTRSGAIGIKSADISELESSTVKSVSINDFTEANIATENQSDITVNKLRVRYGWSHRQNNYQKFFTATDTGSVAAYGETIEDILELPYIRDEDMAKDVAARYLLRRGGKPVYARATINGYHHISEYDLGDVIDITHAHILGGWQNKQFKVVGITDDLMRAQMPIEVISLGDCYGPIVYGGAVETTKTPTVDTYVANGFGSIPNTSYGSSTIFAHGGNTSDFPVTGIFRRCALRFSLADVDAAGGTITSATVVLNCSYVQSPSALQLRQLNSTAWSGSSTLNNFDGSAWTDGDIGGTTLGTAGAGGTGTKTFTLNSSGITYLNSVRGGTNLIQMTLSVMNGLEYYEFTSSDGGLLGPKLLIVYTV